MRVCQTNQPQKMIIHVQTTPDGQVINDGDYQIAGVPNSGSPIKIEFMKPGGEDAHVLPTGNTTDTLDLDQQYPITVSLINAENATAFVTAESPGLKGTELPDEINVNNLLLEKVEKIRFAAAIAMGLAKTIEQARMQPSIPKLAFVSKARTYQTTQGSSIK